MLPYMTKGFIVNETGYVRTTDQPIQEFGRVEGCSCQIIPCCCRQVRWHHENCRWRRASLSPVGFECELHDREACPACDRCDCATWREIDARKAAQATR